VNGEKSKKDVGLVLRRVDNWAVDHRRNTKALPFSTSRPSPFQLWDLNEKRRPKAPFSKATAVDQ
jgi:hypothetical protein